MAWPQPVRLRSATSDLLPAENLNEPTPLKNDAGEADQDDRGQREAPKRRLVHARANSRVPVHVPPR